MANMEIVQRRREARKELLEIMRDPNNGIPDNVKALLETLFPIKTPSRVGGPIGLLKLFGDPPVIGNTITAIEVFQKTGFGNREMRNQIRMAAKHQNPDKRIQIHFEPVTQVYTLTAIGEPLYTSQPQNM